MHCYKSLIRVAQYDDLHLYDIKMRKEYEMPIVEIMNCILSGVNQ